jgi:NitT/TauT family transport system substrate-binding protein
MNRARSLTLLGAAAAGLPQRAFAQAAPAVVRMVAVTGGDFAIGFFATEMGFFKQQNIEVQTTQVPGGGAATAALVGGSFDLAITNLGSTSAAFVRGLPIVVLAGGSLYSSNGPSAFLVGPVNTPIRSAKDLAGKTIGVSTLRDLAQVGIMSWIDQNGGDSHASTYVEMPSLDITPSVIRGRIDVGLVINPRYIEAKDNFHLIATPYDAIAKQFMISAAIVNKTWLEQNLALAQRVVTALRAAAAWGNQNVKLSSDLVSKYTKVPPELVARTPRAPLAVDNDPRMMQPPIDALAKYGFIPRRFAAAEMIAKGV